MKVNILGTEYEILFVDEFPDYLKEVGENAAGLFIEQYTIFSGSFNLIFSIPNHSPYNILIYYTSIHMLCYFTIS